MYLYRHPHCYFVSFVDVTVTYINSHEENCVKKEVLRVCVRLFY